MKGLVRTLLVSALLLFGAFTASAAADDPPAPLQLALGDSWAFGFGDTQGEGGYVPDLYQVLKEDFNCSGERPGQGKAGCPQLQLVNLAIPGAVTAPQPEAPNRPSLTEDEFPDALPLLRSRNLNTNPRDDVEVTTLHIGGNDVATPILNACVGGFTVGCVTTIQAELAAYQRDLDYALSALRGAAGDGRIVIGTYDNTFKLPTCSLSVIPGVSTLGDIVLEGGAPGVSQGLHDIMRAVGAKYDVEVADVFGKFDSQDGFDCLHPDDSGYDKVAKAFEEVLGVGQSG